MHFLSLKDYTKEDFLRIFEKADMIKKDRRHFGSLLKGKTIGLLFEKPSLRTRVSFEVGINNLAARPLYLSQNEVQLGTRESIADVARIMAGYLDGVIIRTFAHETIEEFSKWSDVPVINALTDMYHPAQVLSDYYTIRSKKGDTDNLKIVYVGDGNNMCHSLMYGVATLGGNLVVSSPAGYEPNKEVMIDVLKRVAQVGGSITLEQDPVTAVYDADVVYTDVWTSMGDEEESEERKAKFHSYQLNKSLMSCAKDDAIIMHCLPAHRGEEITDEMMEDLRSVVFEQAQNRLYVQQALMSEVFNV